MSPILMPESLLTLALKRNPSQLHSSIENSEMLPVPQEADLGSEVADERLYMDNPLHILSLPAEIRSAIWKAMLELTSIRRDGNWFTIPRIEFAALSLTCRQLYFEIQIFRPETLIPFKKFDMFITNLTHEWQCPIKIQRYRSLTIQFDHKANAHDFQTLAKALFVCTETIEELRLHFTGSDCYGTKTYLHGCAYAPREGKEVKLPPEGQYSQGMIPLMYEIMRMTKLRILVLSNMNSQLYPMCFKYKPELEYLHVTADPRSAVHTDPNVQGKYAILLQIPPHYYIRVRAMHIDANTMRNAFLIPEVCAETLEHLTWTIPDASLGSNLVNDHLFGHTLGLIDHLAFHARNLTTLRICIGGSGLRGHVQQYSDLERALTGSLNGFRSLRDFEVHVVKKSSWLGHSIVSNLPNGVQRFYTDDQLVTPRELHEFITDKYLSATLSPTWTPLDPEEAQMARWCPLPPLAPPTHDPYPEYCEDNEHCDEMTKMWINPTSYEPKYFDADGAVIGDEIIGSCARKGLSALFLPGIIGENLRRKDYIPLRSGNLKFVFYDFKNPEYTCRTHGVGETLKQMLLRLNGRLLDRDRNKHLTRYSACVFIPPRIAADHELETQYHSQNASYAAMLHSLHEIEHTDPRPREAALEELMNSPFRDDKRYFGNEEAASRIFADESATKPEYLLPLIWPNYVENEEERGDCCRWMCPEADVPTLAEMGDLDEGEDEEEDSDSS